MSSVVGLELPNAWRTAEPNNNVDFDISADQLNVTGNRQMWIPGATIDWATTRMINAGNPTSAQDLTTKTYVDTWTIDRTAGGFDLNDLSNLLFRDTASAPAITDRSIWYADATGMNFNALTGDTFDFQVNGVSQVLINATTIDFQGNTLTDILDITSITSLNGIAIGNYILSTDNLGALAATTSAQLAGVISDETGSGLLVFGTSPTIVTPTIASFVNATHNHQAAAGGGTLVATSALTATGTKDSTTFLRGDDTWDVPVTGSTLPVIDTTSIVEGSADATKELRFEVDGNTTGIIGVIATIFTTAKTITIPNATDTLMGKATVDVITNKSYDLGGTGNVLTGSTTEFNTALQSDSFFFVSQNISNMATSTSAQFDAANSDGTFVLNADNISALAASTVAQYNTSLTGDSFMTFGSTNIVTGAIQITAGTMRVPLSATPTMAVDGDFAIDITVTDFSHGILKYFDGEELGVVSMPIAQFTTPTDGFHVAYNATNDEFELVAGGAGDALTSGTLAQFAATTSAELAGVISDETGSGLLVFGTSPTIVTPTIASFTNATHDHSNAAGGGNLTNSALTSGAFAAITGIGVQTQILNMNTLAIQFSEAQQDIQGNTGGIEYDTPTGDTHEFFVNAVSQFVIDVNIIDIKGNTLQFGEAGQDIVGNAGGIEYDSPTGDTHEFFINAVSQLVIDVNTLDIKTNTLQFDTGQTIVPDAGGLTYNVPTSDTHDFDINSVNELSISATAINAPTATFQENAVDISSIGNQQFNIPSAAMKPATTLPCTAVATRELPTNDVDLNFLAFTSTAADEVAYVTWTAPENYDLGVIRMRFHWTAQGGATGNVRWGFKVLARGNDDPIDTAYGTIQEVTDAWIANDDEHISAFTPNLTLGGTPADGDTWYIKILRSGSDAADTFATTADLISVDIEYTTDIAHPA